MPNANPISGPYNSPYTRYHKGPAKYQKIVTVTNSMLPFTATGSFAGSIGVSTNDNAQSVWLTLADGNGVGGGGTTTMSDFSNNVIYELGVYSISGSLSGDKHIHLYYAY
jgi:hypothetical protein